MTQRIPVHAIDTSGANDGDVPAVDAASGRLEFRPGNGLTVQDANGNSATAVTQIDFQGGGVTASTGETGQVVVTIPGDAAPEGAGEVLMQDGATSPPVPIETEAGDDWLYEG